jgi:phosphatidylglycerophosphatase A
MTKRPTFRFLFHHPAHFIALGFGAGLSPFAPGTFGTLVAIPIAWLLHRHTSDVGYLAVVVATFALGTWAAQVTGKALGVPDHGAIVIDEIAAFLLVLFFTGTTLPAIAIGFVLFRFFDIVKPPPIRYLDTTMKSGLGVMVDDLVAAGYALLVYAVGQRFLG